MWKKKKCFLDMQNLQLISRSIVMLDDTMTKSPIISNQAIVNNFDELANATTLKYIIEKSLKNELDNTCVDQPTPVYKKYIFGNLQFLWELFPPKLSITQVGDGNDVILVVNEMLKISKVKSSIKAVGINYEFFTNQSVDVKKLLLKDKVSKDLDALMIKLVYPINENCRLTLEVSDANYNEQSGVVFAINFHHIIKSSNNIHHLIEDDTFVDKAKDKIAKLLSE